MKMLLVRTFKHIGEMMNKWLEFKVDDEGCRHLQDCYSGCPLCEQSKLQSEIAEKDKRIAELEDMNAGLIAAADSLYEDNRFLLEDKD